MKRDIALMLSVALLLSSTAALAADALPIVKGKKVVALVAGEPITLEELDDNVAAMKPPPAADPSAARDTRLAMLDRLIHVTLIAQEARRMGLDKLPEIRRAMDAETRLMLRDELLARTVKSVQADPRRVEELYRDAVREWKVTAALFANEEHARRMAAEIAAGKDFPERVSAYVAEGAIAKIDEHRWLKRETTDPAILNALPMLTVGAVSPVIGTKSGPVIVMLEDVGYPDNPVAREHAERTALGAARNQALSRYNETLRNKHVTVDTALLKSIDYEAERPGLDALMKDQRPIARIKGEKPVTVADMSEELKFRFYHGTQFAAERKRLNSKKEQALEGIVLRRVLRKEALRLGIDKTDTYRRKVREYENAVLFEATLRKIIAPDIKISEDDGKAYHAEHRDEYTDPEMMRIRSLVFSDRTAAEAAFESLRTGADFQWVAGRADSRVDPSAPGVVTFDGRPIITSELPEGIRKAVSGVKAGDTRLYVSPENYVYVLAIDQVVPATPQPYERVKREIARKVFDARVAKAVEDYAQKLRALSDVKVYLAAQ